MDFGEHGQLYVVISGVKSPGDLSILLPDDMNDCTVRPAVDVDVSQILDTMQFKSIRPTFMVTVGNTTLSSDTFILAAEYHNIIERSLLWLQANLDFDPDSLQAKHAKLVAETVEEEKAFTREQYHCLAIWVGTQYDKDPPNLMSENLCHVRLGDVIEEVLGVKGMRRAPRGPLAECCQRASRRRSLGKVAGASAIAREPETLNLILCYELRFKVLPSARETIQYLSRCAELRGDWKQH
jgi:hypothetical protein